MTTCVCVRCWGCRLARELAEKEDAHLTLEEQYSSLQEEVEVKTKKLKKLWNKWQAANREVQDLQVRARTAGRLQCSNIQRGSPSTCALWHLSCGPLLCVDRRWAAPPLCPLTLLSLHLSLLCDIAGGVPARAGGHARYHPTAHKAAQAQGRHHQQLRAPRGVQEGKTDIPTSHLALYRGSTRSGRLWPVLVLAPYPVCLHICLCRIRLSAGPNGTRSWTRGSSRGSSSAATTSGHAGPSPRPGSGDPRPTMPGTGLTPWTGGRTLGIGMAA